ncbi:MAG TPA: SPOR domain-containing protein [Stellaceae bacterium]|nr:SPOR domain-containing protein [Stellaceae bacterium]
MRVAGLVVLATSLAGCVSPTVTVASLAADGASYAATGKSVSDNGVSAVKGEDCAAWHIFVGKAICRDPRHPLAPAPVEQRRGGSAIAAAAPLSASPAGAWPSAQYLLIGSFVERANADRLARSYLDYNARVLVIRQRGTEFHRVVLGPLGAPQLAALRALGVSGNPLPPDQTLVIPPLPPARTAASN